MGKTHGASSEVKGEKQKKIQTGLWPNTKSKGALKRATLHPLFSDFNLV